MNYNQKTKVVVRVVALLCAVLLIGSVFLSAVYM